MTPHVTDAQLDLYLDDGLDQEERGGVEAHLTDCAACRQRLEAMRPLFESLEALAVSLPEGFAEQVMARLAEPEVAVTSGQRWLRWLAPALEGVVSLAMLVFLAGRLGGLAPLPPAGWLSATAGRLATALQVESEMVRQITASLLARLASVASALPGLLPLQLTATQIGLVLLAATAAWLVSNGLLLRGAALNGNGARLEV